MILLDCSLLKGVPLKSQMSDSLLDVAASSSHGISFHRGSVSDGIVYTRTDSASSALCTGDCSLCYSCALAVNERVEAGILSTYSSMP